MAGAPHSRIEKIAHGCVVSDAFERHIGSLATAGGLDFNAGEAEPSFHHVRLQMDILYPRVVEHDLIPLDNAPGHVNALRIEKVTHRMEAEVKQEECNRRGE